MQPSGATSHYQRSAVKQFSRQQQGDHSGSSSDQLGTYGTAAAAAYGRCPLVPCMPDLGRVAGASMPHNQPITELANLQAALTSEGVQLRRSPMQPQQQPQQQPWVQPPPQQVHSPLRSGLQQHRHHPIGKMSPADAVLAAAAESQTSTKLGQMRTELHVITAQLQGLEHGKGIQQPAFSSPSKRSGLAGSPLPTTQVQAVDARSSLDNKLASAEIVQELRHKLGTAQGKILERLAEAEKQGYSSGTSSSSKISAADQPLQPPPSLRAIQQQQELLGLAGSSNNSKAAALAASLAQQLANSESLQRLQKQHQQNSGLSSKQDLARSGLQQVQDLTEVSQLLLPGLQAQHAAVAECQQRLGLLDSVLRQHPQLANPAAMQSILEQKQRLETQVEALRRENQAKELAHMNTLNVLRENTSTPRDRRVAQLQHENLILQQQLMSREAQMQRMQHMLAAEQQQQQPANASSGELSPVAAEGQRYDELPPPAARQVHRSLWGAPIHTPAYPVVSRDSRSTGGSTCSGSSGSGSGSGSGSSRSHTPSSESDSGSVSATVGLQLRREPPRQAQQQPQQQLQTLLRDLSPGKVRSLTAQFEQQVAAGRAAMPQLQQQLDALQSSPARGPAHAMLQHNFATGPQQQHQQQQSESSSAHAAASAVDSFKQHMDSLERQQQQQVAGMRASMEASHRRQLETERRKHEHTAQQYDLLKEQTEQLAQQLQEAKGQIAALQQHQGLGERRSSGSSGSGIGSSGGAGSSSDRQQQRQRLLHESAVRELQAQLAQARQEKSDLLAQARQEKGDLQAQLDKVLAENATTSAEMKKQVNRLKLAEHALLELQAVREQSHSLKHRFQELQQQLTQAQQAAATAEGTVQECRRQLAAAEAEKGSLMDRIRQLADRASIAESSVTHRSRSNSTSSSAGGGLEAGAGLQGPQQQQQQQLQAELSAACAELNQQVVVLRGQLAEADAKEERLQVANAQLQERLSRLQAESAAKDASTARRASNSSGGSIQQQQQQDQEMQGLHAEASALRREKRDLQKQLTGLQEQLTAAEASAAAAAATAAAGSHKSSDDAQAQQEQQRQQRDQQQQEQRVESLQQEVEQLQAVLEDRTQELQEWQIHADALEKDLEDLKVQVVAAEGVQAQLLGAQTQLASAQSRQQLLLQELEQSRSKVTQLEYDLHGVGQERAVLRARVDALTAELATAREGAADLRLRLEHFTGPAGPQARVRQLEASLQLAQRKLEAAESRASTASARVTELTSQLGGAEDQIVALEGHISVMEEELAKYTQLPQ